MGIYSDNVREYWENGLFTVPCGDGKRPIIGDEWQKYCHAPPTENQIDQWENHFKDVDKMGLLLGPSSNLVAFDFDYEYDERKMTISKKEFDRDRKLIEAEIKRVLPLTPCEKVGRKGWTKFYKWNKGLENRAADRNGVRLFDFLAVNKQTIIPPSFYGSVEGKQLFYRWSADPLIGCLEDIPELDQDCIEELKHFFTDKETELSGRHGLLVSWLFTIFKFETNIDKVSKKLVERDLYENPKNPYLSSDHFKNKNPLVNAKRLAERVFKYKTANPRASDKIKGLKNMTENSYEAFEYFFEEELDGCVREKLSMELKKKDEKSAWQPVLSELDSLKSRAHSKELDHSFTQIHLSQFSKTRPLQLLIEPKEWDGKERLREIFSKFSFKEDSLDKNVCWDLFKDWCANIFRRSDDCMNQNRILIFRGPQGIGKDYFIENVIGKALGPYFVNLEPRDDNKENFMSVHGKLLANISEFDQTSRMTVASIKNLITATRQRIRMPYAPSPQDYSFHCSFFASCNFDSILRDTSGNRRFMIFDIKEIDKTYDTLIQPDQILAEIYHWYKTEFRAPKESFAALEKFITDETPDNPDDLIFGAVLFEIRALEKAKNNALEEAKRNILFDKAEEDSYRVRYQDIQDLISKTAKTFGVSVFRVQGVMKRYGVQRHNGRFRYYSTKELEDSSSYN